jgi:hypothetical protein
LHALDRRRAQIARRYVRRLALEPELGHPLTRGLLATAGCRAVYFDRSSRPDDLFGACRQATRAGNEDASAGPGYRVVYRVLEARRTGCGWCTCSASAGPMSRPGRRASMTRPRGGSSQKGGRDDDLCHPGP